MSKVAIKGNASGTGTFTLEAPNSNTDRTLVLPDEAGTVLTGASALPAANLTGDVASARITNALNASGSAPIYACRAWVNFVGSGTVSINEGGNVSSVIDNGVGQYTINFTTAMPDANYQVSCAGYIDPNNARKLGVQGPRGSFNNPSNAYATGSIQIGCAVGDSGTGNAEMHDTDRVGVAIFR